MEQNTVDSIMGSLKIMAAEKRQLNPEIWLDAAEKLVVLLGDEHDKLFTLQQKVSETKVGFIDSDKSVAEAKIRTEATEEYKEMLSQKAKCVRVEEFIRLAKIQARMAMGL